MEDELETSASRCDAMGTLPTVGTRNSGRPRVKPQGMLRNVASANEEVKADALEGVRKSPTCSKGTLSFAGCSKTTVAKRNVSF